MTSLQRELLHNDPRNQWQEVWDQFCHHRGAIVGAGVFIIVVTTVTLGPFFWEIDPTYI